MTNYDMSKAPGRTYKYYTGTPLFEFGHGLSLTTFAMYCVQTATKLTISCVLQNTGELDGDEVVMAFHSVGSTIRAKVDHPVPIKSLVDFERVRVVAGGKRTVVFKFTEDALLIVNKDGKKVLYPGERSLIF